MLKLLLVGLCLHAQVVSQLDSADAVGRTQRYQNEEFRYYERTHGPGDDGFGMVMARWQQHILEMAATDSLRAVLQQAVERNDPGLPARRTLMECLAAGRSMIVERMEQKWNDFALHWLNNEARAVYGIYGAHIFSLERQGSLSAPYRGVVCDSVGLYSGPMDAALRAEGYGIRRWADGTYQEGNWHEGRLHGWGMEVPRLGIILSGRWRNGRFIGERMEHTSERVYGIDISRYQHEQGRNLFPVNWQQMRITRLSNKEAADDEGFPVSFAYIKATQGTTIESRYYDADAQAARRAGIPVGAYHFLSPMSGRAQAEHFLRVAQPRRGDLPPMLDVELSEAQIEAMGGEDALFNEIETWMRTVHRATATRPILYMGQNFVLKHLPNAPMTLHGHDMWIARYSDYRPYVRLAFWQLSQSGRVNGIHGAVDIDVFNGSRSMFEEWRLMHYVRKDAQ